MYKKKQKKNKHWRKHIHIHTHYRYIRFTTAFKLNLIFYLKDNKYFLKRVLKLGQNHQFNEFK